MRGIDDGSRHSRIQGDSVRVALVVGDHLHPRVQGGRSTRVRARQSDNGATITLIKHGGEELILRRVMVQESRFRDIGGTSDIRKRGGDIALRREQGERLREDTSLLVFAARIGAAGPTGHRYLRIVAHADCSTFTVPKLTTPHHSGPRPTRHPLCDPPRRGGEARGDSSRAAS